MFLDFKEFNGGVVYIGNDSTCKTMGIGSVQIKMFDGVIRKLNDVRYVRDLKKNLISLGVLDASGYCIIFEGGNLKVARGALVAIKGTRRGSIYYLNGTTIIGQLLWQVRKNKTYRIYGTCDSGMLVRRRFRHW